MLGVESPWRVVDVELDKDERQVEVFIEHDRRSRLKCSECGQPASGYDVRERRWRHLDTMQYHTVLVAQVPRAKCSEHGVKQVKVPWAEPGSRFTAMFEALTIDWLHEASVAAVARQLDLSWDEVDGIMHRAVQRGLARRGETLPTHVGIDEKSFQKRHEYVTLIVDQEHGTVLHVSDNRRTESLDEFYQQYSPEELAAIQTISMDMWDPYIKSTRAHVPDADDKIAFDKFHVIKQLTDAVDLVRRKEHRALRSEGDLSLSKSKYLWLQNPDHMSEERWVSFAALRESSLKTARAWAIKELGSQLWDYRRAGWARKAWMKWYGWAIRSQLEPVKAVARMVKRHLDGIINGIVHGVTNARTEGMNSIIQWLKYTARGYRSRQRFRDAIYFHLGGLELYPESLGPA